MNSPQAAVVGPGAALLRWTASTLMACFAAAIAPGAPVGSEAGPAEPETAQRTQVDNPPPTAVTATALSATEIGLSWTSAYAGRSAIYRCPPGGEPLFLGFTSGNRFVDRQQPAGLAWTYHVASLVDYPEGTDSSGLSEPATAQTLALTGSDIGSVGVAGTQSFADGAWRVSGAGADIWGNSDAFRFVHQPWTGDGVLIVRVLGVERTDFWAKAGLMIRESLTPESRYVMAFANPNGDGCLQARASTGGTTTFAITPDTYVPTWLKLVRNGSTFRGYQSRDGATWIEIGAVTVAMPEQVHIGLAVTSHQRGTLCRAQFDNFNISRDWDPTGSAVPVNVRATALAWNQVQVNWTDVSASERGFVIEASTDGVRFQRITTAGANETSAVVSNLSASTRYQFRVRAEDEFPAFLTGFVGCSTPALATTLPPPADAPPAPSSLSAVARSATEIELNWTDNSSSEARFVIERSTDGVTFERWRTAAANATQWTDVLLTPETTYYYRVRAEQADGFNSAPSNVASARTPAETPPPPSGWESRDIGAVGAAGSTTETATRVTLLGSGADIWNTADEFRYRYLAWSGDGEIVVRVTELTNTDPWAKAGVMFRENLTATSRHAAMIVSVAHGTALQYRTTTAGGSGSSPPSGAAESALPRWLRLVRSGNTFTGYASADGTTWSARGTVTIALPAAIYVGLAVTSHNDGAWCTGAFENVSVTGGTTPPPPPPPPSTDTWTSQDIGGVAAAGSTSESGGTVSVTGSGADIWGAADEFRFRFRPLSGDGEIVARVTGLTNTHSWAKAGVMLRTSLEANSPHAFMCVGAGGRSEFQYRASAGGQTSAAATIWSGAPRWVKVVRQGNTFTGFHSSDGTNWIQAGTTTLATPATVYAGLAVTSHSDGVLCTATFESVALSGASGGSGGTGSEPPPPPPPASWDFGDIGGVGIAGSNSSSGNQITIRGSGADIWGPADAFRFVHRAVTGDGVVEARVVSLQNTHGWAKAGVMIRESLAANARNAFAFVTPGHHGVVAQARSTTGGETVSTAGPARNAPYWVRLTRTGNTITAASSPDGVTWTNYAAYTLSLGATAYFGFAVTSHDNTQLNTAVFEDPFVE